MLKVAVGVIKNSAGKILISKRASDVHQGALWEFPGGKFEAGENCQQALSRELQEELGIVIGQAKPLIQIPHHYADKSVLLDVLEVNDFSGKASGLEGQPIKWISSNELVNYSFPKANLAIINAIKLASYYPIVDDSLGSEAAMLQHLDKLMTGGHKLIQLRAKGLKQRLFIQLAKKAQKLARDQKVTLFINTSYKTAVSLQADGVHLDGINVKKISQHEVLAGEMKVAMSCHNELDIDLANKLQVMFAVLSPVLATASHPAAKPLGWSAFQILLSQATVPIYALGGLTKSELQQAKDNGAQGVSGIRGF